MQIVDAVKYKEKIKLVAYLLEKHYGTIYSYPLPSLQVRISIRQPALSKHLHHRGVRAQGACW